MSQKRKWIQAILAVSITMSVGATTLSSVNAEEEVATKIELKDDLYTYVNQEWMDDTEIPNHLPMYSYFNQMDDDVTELLMEDLDKMSQGEIEATNDAMAEAIKLHDLAKDFERRETEGVEAALPFLEEIEAAKNYDDLFQGEPIDWIGLPFNYFVAPDMKDTQTFTIYLGGFSNILPEKSYYDAFNPSKPLLYDTFSTMSQEILERFGYEPEVAEAHIERALQFDSLTAKAMQSAEEQADVTSMYHPVAFSEFSEYSDSLPLGELMTSLLGDEPEEVIVTNPAFFEQYNNFINENNFEKYQSWLLVTTAVTFADLFDEDLRQIANQYNMFLSGTQEAMSQDKFAYMLTTNFFDQVIGDYYAKTYFGPDARTDVEEMANNMINVFKTRLENNEWLTEETIENAIKKLDTMVVQVGYPDEFPEEYNKFSVDPDLSLFENYLALGEVVFQEELRLWNTSVDFDQWPTSPSTVNAFYNPQANTITFPAAVLQAPFYSTEQSPEENYGGIGAVMAHEITHAFDNNGSKFDQEGNLNDWWTEEDYDVFEEKTQAMIEQFDGLNYYNGTINGTLTVSENIADNGGVAGSLAALLEQDEDANLEEYFLNWAKIWAMDVRPEFAALLLQLDVHSPNPARANETLKNFDLFYETFDISEGDGMYLAPEDRLVIW